MIKKRIRDGKMKLKLQNEKKEVNKEGKMTKRLKTEKEEYPLRQGKTKKGYIILFIELKKIGMIKRR